MRILSDYIYKSVATQSAKECELPQWDSTEAESSRRAVETVKLPQALNLITDNL